jgi:hypothetical protein
MGPSDQRRGQYTQKTPRGAPGDERGGGTGGRRCGWKRNTKGNGGRREAGGGAGPAAWGGGVPGGPRARVPPPRPATRRPPPRPTLCPHPPARASSPTHKASPVGQGRAVGLGEFVWPASRARVSPSSVIGIAPRPPPPTHTASARHRCLRIRHVLCRQEETSVRQEEPRFNQARVLCRLFPFPCHLQSHRIRRCLPCPSTPPPPTHPKPGGAAAARAAAADSEAATDAATNRPARSAALRGPSVPVPCQCVSNHIPDTCSHWVDGRKHMQLNVIKNFLLEV